ncbi:thiamine pyrophosphate-binding protein [Brenneria izbisi]|uniref:Thiamine pyrophosphate-binding protein n=1 Tax=Brenneria izbisi TaxID=2939450 RepID=A0AA41XYT3_9GAMM|nr:thiamine pyrophosphate-dependent enzyme [Brenneria izbisi]MCV9877499.1 thiamine pyrophosphate-binding protein [Brenneria izbisi]MCV9880935.1 thiamine pyrophosphate-binding protein [Brenneria izbisi]
MKYFSDLVVSFLVQQGIEYVSFNPGASFRGIHDSLVAMREKPGTPQILVSCHEEISVAIAHGYFKACGKHMAVIVHANIGLQHASMAIFNAWCDRVPLLVLGGNGPIDASKRRPWIDWIHTSQSIDSIIKDYVKWSDMPMSQKAALESLYRGAYLMNSEAKAPVFIALDSEIQEETLHRGLQLYPVNASQAAQLPGLDNLILSNLVTQMLSAQNPVIITDLSGKEPETVPLLIQLAETLGCAVIDKGGRYNFPNTHDLSLNDAAHDIILDSDMILAFEVQDLWGALQPLVESGYDNLPTIISIGTNNLLISDWAADYQRLLPVSQMLQANIARSLEQILASLELRIEEVDTEKRKARLKQISERHVSTRNSWQEQALSHSDDKIVHVTSALLTIHDALEKHDWMVTNTGSVTINEWVKRLWNLDKPGCYIGLSGGAGLGYGLGASIGAALAHKGSDKVCINLQSDGDFLYTPSALWTLSQYEIPLLTIVMNNSLYLNSKQHAEIIAGNRQRNVSDADIGTSFYENPVDFISLAQSFNIHTSGRASTLAELKNSLEEAIDYILKERKPALVELIMQ